MKTLSWTLKFIVFPLLPFFFGTGARWIQRGYFSAEAINAAELAFSMALLTLIVSVKTSRLPEASLRDALTQMFHLAVLLFVALFSAALFIDTDINAARLAVHRTIEARVANGQAITSSDLVYSYGHYEDILKRLRTITILLSIATIPLVMLANRSYKLEDL